ncbi:hypothetical protein OKA05_02115 [Luteolibacter arcticus]|uniref:Lipoprotein n=1 Tax=Luteolibacter arcticus TaxID=1581411 RepID=A0ABT3GD35_9BACT|nr:hypothetical protein [Luteolibacter arcticus]MCW1921328.1 hypothetical protein [Luteolibacter arcticus]
MKSRILSFLAVAAALALASCASTVPESWEGTANPLDTPGVESKRPEALGDFGPHSEFYDR